MKAIMVMYDSLNRHLLETYGCDWTLTPNFRRLAEKSVQFENNYVGSLPCMPARRELHTGRLSFFHRSWGPLEPFDDSMPELLKKSGIYTHLVSDHIHYWEDGGATYHARYSSWEISRGQEGDTWKAELGFHYDKESVFNGREKWLERPSHRASMTQDAVNRRAMNVEEATSQAVTFHNGLEFIERNHGEDNWFLQIETFDPHEPFYTLPEDRALYPHRFQGDDDREADWPLYTRVTEDPDTVELVRSHYAALLTKCDRYLGKVLDMMDRYGLWEDTMLIVNTDHGFLLGEHGWWGKSAMPVYEEIAHIPLYVYDPRCPQYAGERRHALTQTIDLAPTLLEYFGVEVPKDMEGRSLRQVIEEDSPIRPYAVYGYFGSQINITDGRYVYMHSAEKPDAPLYEYTLMPMHMRGMFSVEELKGAELAGPFSFTKDLKILKIPGRPVNGNSNAFGSILYDLEGDTAENLMDREPERLKAMREYLYDCMVKNDAPPEAFERMGLRAKA